MLPLRSANVRSWPCLGCPASAPDASGIWSGMTLGSAILRANPPRSGPSPSPRLARRRTRQGCRPSSSKPLAGIVGATADGSASCPAGPDRPTETRRFTCAPLAIPHALGADAPRRTNQGRRSSIPPPTPYRSVVPRETWRPNHGAVENAGGLRPDPNHRTGPHGAPLARPSLGRPHQRFPRPAR